MDIQSSFPSTLNLVTFVEVEQVTTSHALPLTTFSVVALAYVEA
jgi:hypothetical protein